MSTIGAGELKIKILRYLSTTKEAKFVLSRAASAIHVPHPKSETSNDMSVLRNKEYLHSKYKMKETELLVGMRAVPLNAHLAQEYSSQNLQG